MDRAKKKYKSGHEKHLEKKRRCFMEAANSSFKITKFCSNSSEALPENRVNSDVNHDTLDNSSGCCINQVAAQVETSDVVGVNNDGISGIEPTEGLQITTPQTIADLQPINYFVKPSLSNVGAFFEFHPVQPEGNKSSGSLHFDSNKAFFRQTSSGEFTNRSWLTFDELNQKLYCTVCMVFSNSKSVFTNGFQEWKHVYQRIEEHESSKSHCEAAKSYMRERSGKGISSLINSELADLRHKEVYRRRNVMRRIIEVIKLMGKQGLAFRGHKNEAAYSLDDYSVNHGNFLEIILLLAESDEILREHVNKCIQMSKAKHSAGSTGRGNLLTFLSPTTINKIIQEIGKELRHIISEEVRKAGIYSVTMDTTMDITSHDQCVIVLRYVIEADVVERVIGLKHATSTTGLNLYNLLRHTLTENNIGLDQCVADAFDGASNMSSQYQGVQAHLKEAVPNHIHTWCYAHVLNLVVADTSQCVTSVASFFSILQEAHVFFKESYKRLSVYENKAEACGKRPIHLSAIGATRWRSKHDALVKIFGYVHMWSDGSDETNDQRRKTIYTELLLALDEIAESPEFTPKIRSDAKGMLTKFSCFETVLIAMMFLRIFKVTTPLSDYLQTSNIDYVQAWRQTDAALKTLRSLRQDFQQVLIAAKRFVAVMNEELDNFDTEICVESQLPKVRQRKRKRLAGELAEDECVASTSDEHFRIHVFNVVIDRVVTSMETRFSEHRELYGDLECFDPRRFRDLVSAPAVPQRSLEKICSLVPKIEINALKEELISFAKLWPEIKGRSFDEFYTSERRQVFEEQEWIDEEEERSACTEFQKCNACLTCVLKVLREYNMYCLEYRHLYDVYKYLLTIPLTQVSCERSFSKLKIIKTRLRSTVAQENLEALFLMNCERVLTTKVDPDKIIKALCETSSELRRALIL